MRIASSFDVYFVSNLRIESDFADYRKFPEFITKNASSVKVSILWASNIKQQKMFGSTSAFDQIVVKRRQNFQFDVFWRMFVTKRDNDEWWTARKYICRRRWKESTTAAETIYLEFGSFWLNFAKEMPQVILLLVKAAKMIFSRRDLVKFWMSIEKIAWKLSAHNSLWRPRQALLCERAIRSSCFSIRQNRSKTKTTILWFKLFRIEWHFEVILGVFIAQHFGIIFEFSK